MAEPNDAPLSPAQRSKIRRLSAHHEPAPGEEAGELNIVPFLDIITNIMMFVLATVTTTFLASVDTAAPSIGGGKVRSDVASNALNLSVLITGQGISFKTSGGNISTGCESVGTGLTVPKKNNENDLATVTACAKRLKNAKEEFKEETQVTITASNDIELQTVVDVIDALRNDGEEELFPEVHFGVAR